MKDGPSKRWHGSGFGATVVVVSGAVVGVVGGIVVVVVLVEGGDVLVLVEVVGATVLVEVVEVMRLGVLEVLLEGVVVTKGIAVVSGRVVCVPLDDPLLEDWVVTVLPGVVFSSKISVSSLLVVNIAPLTLEVSSFLFTASVPSQLKGTTQSPKNKQSTKRGVNEDNDFIALRRCNFQRNSFIHKHKVNNLLNCWAQARCNAISAIIWQIWRSPPK